MELDEAYKKLKEFPTPDEILTMRSKYLMDTVIRQKGKHLLSDEERKQIEQKLKNYLNMQFLDDYFKALAIVKEKGDMKKIPSRHRDVILNLETIRYYHERFEKALKR